MHNDRPLPTELIGLENCTPSNPPSPGDLVINLILVVFLVLDVRPDSEHSSGWAVDTIELETNWKTPLSLAEPYGDNLCFKFLSKADSCATISVSTESNPGTSTEP